MTNRKSELTRMCRLEIRRTVTLAKMALANYAYHLAEPVVDAEIEAMMERLTDKSVRSDDVTLLRELVIEDLWLRLRAAHKEHRDYVFDAVKKLNRETISVDASFAFDIGWNMLLQSAADRVETYPLSWKARIVGGKEKLGCFVIHIDYDDGQPGARSEVERLRQEIRLRSLATCDICGGQGRLRLSSIAKTVCDRHAAVLGEMREDDGRWADPWRGPDSEDHMTDVMSASDGEIADETGRAELIIRFVGQIETAVVAAMSVADDDVDFWLRTEIDQWQCVQPVSDDDREFLHGYLRELIDAEYQRVKAKTVERDED